MSADDDRAASSALVLDNHSVTRDGSFWTCRFCGGQWPYPSPLPEAVGPCVPRAWGEAAGPTHNARRTT